jgi:hypothetical protein
MADTSVFSRLRRLFGTDVVIRNVGGNQLKVADTNQIQSTGKYQTNSLLDRFSRLYQYNNRNSFNPNLNYQTLRVQIYSDYEAMDTDPIIASALDIIAEEASLRNDLGEVLTIKSSDENIQKILYNLFYDVLNIEFNLWSWVRNLAKYGDFYLKLEVAEEFGVYNVIPYTVYHITRHEGEDLENPTKVEFRLNLNGVASSIDPNFTVRSESSSIIPLDNYEIAHFRLLADTTYLPYGRSYLEPARKIYKQLTLMEDAMLIHRIMRSPEKRMFFINVGSIPPAEVEQFMQKTINQIKKEPYIDPKTGQYNLRFNLQNMMEDFYIPVRGGDTSTRIDTTKGLEYDGIKDVEYLRDKMFAALRVPKAYMGYEGDLQGKCLHPDTEIKLLDGTVRTIKDIAELFEKDPNIKLYAYSFDFTTNRVVPGEIVLAEKTRKNAALVKVWIDNGTYIVTTPDHGYLLQDGTRVEAQDLKEGDSLRTIITRRQPIARNANEYEQVFQPSENKWEFTHKMVDNYYNGVITNNGYNSEGSFDRDNLVVVHHKDFNRYNNNPTNLERVTTVEHIAIHSQNVEKGIHSETARLKAKQTKQTEAFRAKASKIQKDRIQTNPELGVKLRDSWLSKTHEERVRIVQSGLTVERSSKISENNRKRNSVQHLRTGYKQKFPTGRPDLQGSSSVRWKERETFEEILNTLQDNRALIKNIKDLNRLTGMCQYMTREVLNEHGYTTNQFLNEFLGFSKNRSKEITREYFRTLAEGSNSVEDLAAKMNTSVYGLRQFVKKYKYESELETSLGACYNHKVVKVEQLSETVDTYNMEVYDVNENHNFLLANDIVVKNSTLAAEDIRFARTVERIQRVVESELTKIALIHLYVQGYKGESLTNFELKLATPSTIYEQEKVALLKEKVDLAAQMMTSNLFPSDFIYEHLFNLSEDKYFEFRDLVREDKKRAFRISQIENEGNDPVESGLSYGTPHDLASMYGRRDSKDEKVPVGYSEQPQQGRPVVHKSIVGTPDDPLGGIDRLGKKGMKGGYPSDAELNERRLRAVVSDKKQLIYEQDRVEGSNLLDESNILDL